MSHLVVLTFTATLALAVAIPRPQQGLVSGIFISADTLKQLENQSQGRQGAVQPVINQSANGQTTGVIQQPINQQYSQQQPIYNNPQGQLVTTQPLTNQVIGQSQLQNGQRQPTISYVPNSTGSQQMITLVPSGQNLGGTSQQTMALLPNTGNQQMYAIVPNTGSQQTLQLNPGQTVLAAKPMTVVTGSPDQSGTVYAVVPVNNRPNTAGNQFVVPSLPQQSNVQQQTPSVASG